MQIADVRVSVHRFAPTLPLVGRPAGDSLRVICEIETADGLCGLGMTGRFLAHGVAAAIERHLAPALRGLDSRDFEAIHARLQPVVSERGQMTGVNLAALSCVDLALWDIVGKASGRTVAQLLGGHADRAKVYVTYGFGAYDRDQLVEMARRLMAEGHTRLKVLVGVAKCGIVEDAARVRHVREAVGDGITLAIDANESLGLEEAKRLCRLVEDLDLAWFEDPLARCDARDMGALRRATSIPLAAGQMDGHSRRFREWLEHDAIDIFMPNGMYNGGMTETPRVACLAQIYNRPLSDAGGGGIFCLHHVAGFRNGTLAECHLGVEQVEQAISPMPRSRRAASSRCRPRPAGRGAGDAEPAHLGRESDVRARPADGAALHRDPPGRARRGLRARVLPHRSARRRGRPHADDPDRADRRLPNGLGRDPARPEMGDLRHAFRLQGPGHGRAPAGWRGRRDAAPVNARDGRPRGPRLWRDRLSADRPSAAAARGPGEPLAGTVNRSFHEVQKYFSMANHVYTPVTFVMNGRKFDSLSAEHQELVKRAALEAA